MDRFNHDIQGYFTYMGKLYDGYNAYETAVNNVKDKKNTHKILY